MSEEVKTEAPKKEITPIAGKTIQREKGTGEKIANSFFANDAHNIGDYLIFDIVIPAVKNVLADVVEDTINMLLFGSTKRTSRSSKTLGTKVSYADYYNRGRNDRRSDRIEKGSDGTSYDDIAFETKADAIEAMEQLISIIDEYETASIADFYEICGKEGKFTDNNYGWTKKDMGKMEVLRSRNGYYIDLPRPRQI